MFYTNISDFLDDSFFRKNISLVNSNFVYDLIEKTEGNTKITVVVPGYDKSELKLDVEQNILKLSCETKGKEFVRKWKVAGVELEKIKADCQNGILTILLQSKENPKKSITIQ